MLFSERPTLLDDGEEAGSRPFVPLPGRLWSGWREISQRGGQIRGELVFPAGEACVFVCVCLRAAEDGLTY